MLTRHGGAPADVPARFVRMLEAACAELPSPGLNAAVLVDDAIVWAGAVGVARHDTAMPLTPQHLHRIGSITKLFTAHAILQLRDEGALDLDAPVRAYLPEFTQPGTERVTLRHILCHGSGVPTNGLLDVWQTGVFPDRTEFRALIAAMPVVAPPMRYTKYSNMAFSMLGLVIENVSGMAYETFVTERLLRPLGMRDAAFYLTPEQEARLASGHTTPPYERRFEVAPYQDLRTWNACGMLAATASEVLALARLQWTPGALLREETREEMHRLHSMDTDALPWTIGYGLGWRFYRVGDRVFAGHGGAYVGNRCQLLVSVPDRAAVALFANANHAVNVTALAAAMLGQVVDAFPQWRPPAAPAPVPDTWRPLLGSYAVRHWHEARIEYGPDGLRLTSPLEGGPGIPLRQIGEGRFLMLAGRGAGEPLEVRAVGPDGRATEISAGGMIYRRI